jgi:hypothetical protein
VLARRWVWGGSTAALAVAVAVGTAGGATRTARLSGFVLSAPATPVCMPRVPCMRPAAGVVLAFRRVGVVPTRVRTARDGSYHVLLAPGTYAVRVAEPLGVRRPKPATVTVSAGHMKRVTFYLDSGIR